VEGLWGRVLKAVGPLTILPQTPNPNPIWKKKAGGVGAASPAFPSLIKGVGRGV